MSSISGFSHTDPMTINYLGQGQYKVENKRDKDGDGVVDGEALGEEGKIVNESAVNQLLAARGLKVVNGQYQSIDGFSLTSPGAAAATSFGSDPPLPGISGEVTDPKTLGSRLDWSAALQGLSDACLMWLALSTLARTSMRDVSDAKDIKRAMQDSKLQWQQASIDASATKIEKEKSAAWTSFAWQCASAVVSALAAGYSSGGEGRMSAALSASAGGLGQAVGAFGTASNKNWGAQAKADRKEIEAKHHERLQAMADMAVDDAKANYDEAKELFKLALKIMTEHVERQTQVVQGITRG